MTCKIERTTRESQNYQNKNNENQQFFIDEHFQNNFGNKKLSSF